MPHRSSRQTAVHSQTIEIKRDTGRVDCRNLADLVNLANSANVATVAGASAKLELALIDFQGLDSGLERRGGDVEPCGRSRRSCDTASALG